MPLNKAFLRPLKLVSTKTLLLNTITAELNIPVIAALKLFNIDLAASGNLLNPRLVGRCSPDQNFESFFQAISGQALQSLGLHSRKNRRGQNYYIT